MENPSGIHPIEYKCLVEPIKAEEKIGNIFIPDEARDREQFATMKGRLVEPSPNSFPADEYGEHRPKAGDLILYAKYSGVLIEGNNRKEYRLINDKDVIAIIEE